MRVRLGCRNLPLFTLGKRIVFVDPVAAVGQSHPGALIVERGR